MMLITRLLFSRGGGYEAKSQFWRMLAELALFRPLLIALQEVFFLPLKWRGQNLGFQKKAEI